jgi:hypothetical protein
MQTAPIPADVGNFSPHPLMLCTLGPDGDAYCTAFFHQFVVHGKAAARCAPGRYPEEPATCIAAGCVCLKLVSTTLCVERERATTCQDLCAP